MPVKDRLIVALDVKNRKEARSLVRELSGLVGMFKIGHQLFTAEGPEIVRIIAGMGEKIFLDLKYHDIPSVIAGAAVAALELGVSMLTLHALGGAKMMSYTSKAVRETAEALQVGKPLLIGVTILTSMDQESLKQCGIERDLPSMVYELACLATASGLDGIVASPKEVSWLRSRGMNDLLMVTPGIRPEWAEAEDQQRIMTPYEALRQGADYLVVGRPITRAKDPTAAADKVLMEMESFYTSHK
jgi:orotidine-5'-phosphate decarboxylase